MAGGILIVGATGQQGRATIAALSATETPRRILALTRSASSSKSQALLKEYPRITLVEGDVSNYAPILATNPDIASIFLVTVPPNDEAQAFPFLESVIDSNTSVEHIVFSSIDRGGDASWETPTTIPHFAAKHRIEHRLRDLCREKGVAWTILRPTGFMDTYNPGFFGRFMAALWAEGMPVDRRMQLISTRDIGNFAAKALTEAGWKGRAVALAGDDLSITEIRDVFRKTVGKELPELYGIMTWPVLWWVEDARESFKWFRTAGWQADISDLRVEEPRLQTFEMWLRDSSQWEI